MSLERRSLRNAARVIAEYQDGAPETTDGWIRFFEAVTAVGMAADNAAPENSMAADNAAPATYQHAPDRSLIPYLDRILAEIEKLDLYIRIHPFDNTQKNEYYTDIILYAKNDIFPALSVIGNEIGHVDNFSTESDGNNLIINVFSYWGELTRYFAHQFKVEEANDTRLSTGAQGSSPEPDWNIGEKSERFRTNLTNAVKKLKAYIEKEEATRGGKKSRKRRRKKSIKRRRKKKSGVTRRKKKSRRNRCK